MRGFRYFLIFCGTFLLLVFLCGGGFFYRYNSTGVSPFHEVKQATLGQSIEIKEFPEADGSMYRQLLLDGIVRGFQYTEDRKPGGQFPGWNWKRQPTTYYHVNGPVGMAFHSYNWCTPAENTLTPGDARLPVSLIGMLAADPLAAIAGVWSEPAVGVIFMGNATLAAYARPFQFFDFYEHNPNVKKLSFDDNPAALKFTYAYDALKRGANLRVMDGPERQTFDREAPKGFYRLLIVETSHGHSDLPARELLTQEAMKSFLDSLADEGVICYHTSSRSFDLPRLLATLCERLQLKHVRINDSNTDRNKGEYTSEWFMVAREDQHLVPLRFAVNLRNFQPARGNNALPGGLQASQTLPMPGVQWLDKGPNSLLAIRR